jgi:hypothetical protein
MNFTGESGWKSSGTSGSGVIGVDPDTKGFVVIGWNP